MRIYLVGYSYSGKTTLGRQLAKQLNCQFFDTDKAIELKYHITISLFFHRYGEHAFRIVERQILESTAELDHAVVSTGGGTPCSGDNMDFILAHGTAIYMQMNVDEIMHRIAVSHKQRPLLAGMDETQQRAHVCAHLALREPFYKKAPLTLPAFGATVEDLRTLVEQAMPDNQNANR